MMVPSQQQTTSPHENSIFAQRQLHYGRVRPLGFCNWYSAPHLYVFVITYILSVVLCIVMMTQVFVDGYSAYFGRILCIYILYRYFNLALSNPGLAVENQISVIENHRFCSVCQIHVRKFTRHCQFCDACIEGFDHHCIFIGKCVGKDNFGQFKQFICLIFGTLIYAFVVSIMTINGSIKPIGGNPSAPNLQKQP